MNDAPEPQPAHIPAPLVSAIGRALYGVRWHGPMARALKIQDHTMRRWINDGAPASHAQQLCRMLEERAAEITAAATELKAFDAAG